MDGWIDRQIDRQTDRQTDTLTRIEPQILDYPFYSQPLEAASNHEP